MSHIYYKNMLCALLFFTTHAHSKIITLTSRQQSAIDSMMRVANRVIPQINITRVGKAVLPYSLAGVYVIYTTAQDKIEKMNFFARGIKNIVGGVQKKVDLVKQKNEMCDYGISGLLKPFGSLIKIDTEEPLFKIAAVSYFKDQIYADLKDLKIWLQKQKYVLQEEFSHIYRIPENCPLTPQERAVYLEHLLEITMTRNPQPLNDAVLFEISEGYTAEELDSLIASCNVLDESAINQVATTYAGRCLMHKLLNPEDIIRAVICPVYSSNKTKSFGKIACENNNHVLNTTTRQSELNQCKILLAGKIAAELKEIELSNLLTEECDKQVTYILSQCVADPKEVPTLLKKLEDEVRAELIKHDQELDVIANCLKKHWEIPSPILDEIMVALA